jgi:hypothetical protein
MPTPRNTPKGNTTKLTKYSKCKSTELKYLHFSKSAEATRSPESISLKLCEDVSEILLNFSEIQTNLSTHDCAKNLIKK